MFWLMRKPAFFMSNFSIPPSVTFAKPLYSVPTHSSPSCSAMSVMEFPVMLPSARLSTVCSPLCLSIFTMPPFVPTYKKLWSWMIFVTKFLLEMFCQSVNWACAVMAIRKKSVLRIVFFISIHSFTILYCL